MFFAVLLLLCLLPGAARADQRWLVVSDIHLNPYDASPQPAPYHTDSNWALVRSALERMHTVDPDPGVVFIAGDFLAHRWADKVHAAGFASSEDQALATMRRIAAAFGERFPKAQFVVTVGNNDDPCGDYRTAPGTAYMQKLARIWGPLVDRHGAAPDFVRDFSRTGAYAARLPIPGLKAVEIDDIYWSFVYRPCGAAQNPDPGRVQQQWLERQTATRGSRSILLMHIPPGADPVSTMLTHRFLIVPFTADRWSSAYERFARSNKRRIAFALAGHVHRDEFRILGGVPMLVAPSISPIYDNNPAFLTIDVAPDGTLHDYRNYAYQDYSGTWVPPVDFDALEGTRRFTAPQLEDLRRRLQRNERLRDGWATLQMSGMPDRTTELAWRMFWCAQTDFGAAYAACAGSQRRVAAVPVIAGLLGAAVLGGIALIALRLARQRRAR